MRVYVNSSGMAPHHDYRWRLLSGASEANPLPDESDASSSLPEGSEDLPPLVNDEQIKSFLEEENASVVLVRSGKALGLLVTGLQTAERRDYTQKRWIRNTLACVGDLEEELVMRGIAVSALHGKLEALVDESVRSSAVEPAGFEVASDLVTKLRDLAAEGDEENQHPENRFGKNSEHLRQELADELNLYKLPDRDGILVVVTTLVTPARFIQAQVWRSLSDLVKEEIDEEGNQWAPLPSLPAGNHSAWLAQFLIRFRSFWVWMSSLSRR